MSARDPTIAARSKRYSDRKRSDATVMGKPAHHSGKTAGGDFAPATRATPVARPRSAPPATEGAATVGAATVEVTGPIARACWTLGAALLTIIALLISALALA